MGRPDSLVPRPEVFMLHRSIATSLALAMAAVLASCGGSDSTTTTTTTGTGVFTSNPCSPVGTLTLASAQAARIDCTNGGTTLTLAGNGASYVIVPQFPTNLVVNQSVPYTLATGNLAAASLTASRVAAMRANPLGMLPAELGMSKVLLPGQRQLDFERGVMAHARSVGYTPASTSRRSNLFLPPTLGSTRTFKVLSNFNTGAFSTVTAQLAYLGSNVYLYIDVNAPTNGFTPVQLTNFGQLFDQTLYDIGVGAFGQPSDLDQNGHIIMLMSQVVNADTPASACATTGYVAGFFDSEDFNGPTDPNSNQGEIFYSIVPDPTGITSCTHTVSDIGATLPATFLHELQHLINFSQHVVVNHINPMSSSMDEGLSIVAEELGSLYYEQKCPPPSCRTNASQLFPDSSQGFIQGFFNDSYLYALLPDTASLTLHNDSENGFSWRGGDWLLMRYLGDQYGNNFFKQMEQGVADGPSAATAATGVPFATLFANFGLALYTDSFPGLPRATAPAVNRFVSRNLRQLWGRYAATSGGSQAMPLKLIPITGDTSTLVMAVGAMSFWRLDTPASSPTVTIRFASPGGFPLSVAYRPQLAVFRLPAGQ